MRAIAFLLAAAMTLSACSAGRGSPTDSEGVAEINAAGDRQEVDAFSGELLDGGRFDSSSLAGKVFVYNVWGSWCAPCRTEAATLQQVSEETQDLGVRLVGINVRDNDASARAFEDTYDVEYPSITIGTSSEPFLRSGRRCRPALYQAPWSSRRMAVSQPGSSGPPTTPP